MALYAVAGWFTLTGFARPVNAAVGLGVGIIAVALSVGAARLVLWAVRTGPFPPTTLAAFLGALLSLLVLRELPYFSLGLPGTSLYLLGGLFIAAQALLAGGASRLRAGDPVRGAGMAAGGAALDAALLWLLLTPGPGVPEGVEPALAGPSAPEVLSTEDPGIPGPYEVRRLVYGSGDDRRRAVYRDSVDLATERVDASRVIPAWQGFKAAAREWYWGFGPERFPLNGRVWYPAAGEEGAGEDAGPLPLVLVVHGNHAMEDPSDGGYAYLGRLLASRGFAVASVDENFINATWSGDFGGREMAARSWLLLEHLRLWHEWARGQGSPFGGRIDTSRIALVGHSRGGEAVAMAAAFNRLSRFPDDGRVELDYGYGVRAVVALAPTDRRYHRRMSFKGASYLTLHGSWDSDEASFEGLRQFQRVELGDGTGDGTPPGPPFKAAVYVHRANHGQFNTGWGRRDYGLPGGWLLNTAPILSPEEQRDAAATFVSAFLEATLRGRDEYADLFRDPRTGREWLPPTLYVSRYQAAGFRPVATYEEDADLETATAEGARIEARGLSEWKEEELEFRDGDGQANRAVHIGWGGAGEAPGRSPLYLVRLPAGEPAGGAGADPGAGGSGTAEGAGPPPGRLLRFDLARPGGESDGREKEDYGGGREPLDFTLEVVDAGGTAAEIPLRDLRPVPPRVRVRLMKYEALTGSRMPRASETILQTYVLPLSRLAEGTPGFRAGEVREVRFRFDRIPAGKLVLDNLGFLPARGAVTR